MLRYLTPEYYQENYSTVYALKGNEAGVEFELLLNDYMGDAEINAGNLLPTALETADGTVIEGVCADGDGDDVSTLTVETNVPVNGYKRFDYSEDVGDIAYLTITVPNGSGGTVKYMFEVGDPYPSHADARADDFVLHAAIRIDGQLGHAPAGAPD